MTNQVLQHQQPPLIGPKWYFASEKKCVILTGRPISINVTRLILILA